MGYMNYEISGSYFECLKMASESSYIIIIFVGQKLIAVQYKWPIKQDKMLIGPKREFCNTF